MIHGELIPPFRRACFPIPGQSRERGSDVCETCTKRPWPDDDGHLVCDCPHRFWQHKRGAAGLPADRALLERYGWHLIHRPDDTYWVGPHARIVYLFEDGTWACDTAPSKCTTLEAYLGWYAREAASWWRLESSTE
jgi:hypothetical protein